MAAPLHDRRMTPHITLLTLGVEDLERAVGFYRDGLGFDTKGIVGNAYAGYFQDPDGHLWEVAFNPGFASLGW